MKNFLRLSLAISISVFCKAAHEDMGIANVQEEDITVCNLTEHTPIYAAVYIRNNIADSQAPKYLYGGVHVISPGHTVTLKRPAGLKWKFGLRDVYFSTKKDDLVHELKKECSLRVNKDYVNVGSTQGKEFAIAPAKSDKIITKVVDYHGTQLVGGKKPEILKALEGSKNPNDLNQPAL